MADSLVESLAFRYFIAMTLNGMLCPATGAETAAFDPYDALSVAGVLTTFVSGALDEVAAWFKGRWKETTGASRAIAFGGEALSAEIAGPTAVVPLSTFGGSMAQGSKAQGVLSGSALVQLMMFGPVVVVNVPIWLMLIDEV